MVELKPEKEIVAVWRIMLSLIAIVIAFIIFLFLKDKAVIISIAVWVILFMFAFWVYIPVFYKNTLYLLDNRCVVIQKGFFYTNQYAIPFKRVQFTSVTTSPILSFFGLVTLKVVTAGAKISLSGLKPDKAHSLIKIIEEAGDLDEESPE